MVCKTDTPKDTAADVVAVRTFKDDDLLPSPTWAGYQFPAIALGTQRVVAAAAADAADASTTDEREKTN